MTTPAFSVSGLIYSVSASTLFGLMPWYIQFLTPLNGNALLWSRIVFSSLFGLTALLYCHKWQEFKAIFTHPRHLVATIFSTLIIMVQWWLFVWAPLNEQTAELALGYFLLPLTLTLLGWGVYKEKLSSLQKAAIALAITGVGYELFQQGSLPWVTVAVATLYPIYFMLKHYTGISTVPGFMFECLLFLPVALFALGIDNHFWQIISDSALHWLLLPGLGILCSTSFFFYIAASRQLPVSLFGLLTYLEPAILLAVTLLVLNEPITDKQWITYSFIWAAATLVGIDSIQMVRQSIATKKNSTHPAQ